MQNAFVAGLAFRSEILVGHHHVGGLLWTMLVPPLPNSIINSYSCKVLESRSIQS